MQNGIVFEVIKKNHVMFLFFCSSIIMDVELWYETLYMDCCCPLHKDRYQIDQNALFALILSYFKVYQP